MRIVFLPIDERFCTRDYFIMMAKMANIEIITPPKELLGIKKNGADTLRLHKFLLDNTKRDDILILSLDTLIHGGLIPSRINHLSYETIIENLEIIKSLKNKGTKIYICATVTRIPKYDSSDEEPDYWEYYGKKLNDITKDAAQFFAVSDNNLIETTPDYLKFLFSMKIKNIPEWILSDFFTRRERNFKVISYIIDLVRDGYIDFLNLTLDDNSEGSLSLFESKLHSSKINNYFIKSKTSIHAGADESSLTMLSKALCDYFSITPSFRVTYLNPDSKFLIPPYEGNPLCESVENHIKAAGGCIADQLNDIELIINNSDGKTESEAFNQQDFIESKDILFSINDEKITGISDVKYANGCDHEIIEFLLKEKRNWNKINVAGWNTQGNTTGTVCAYSVIQHLCDNGYLALNQEKMIQFQAVLLLENWAYQSDIRQLLRNACIERGCNIWTLMPAEIWAKEYCDEKLQKYIERLEPQFGKNWKVKTFFPWHRSFEIGIELE